MVTVGELIERLRQFRPETPVRIEFDTHYDGNPCTVSGPADDCPVLYAGSVIIFGSDRRPAAA
jgi:hypothetical protein